MLVSDFTRNILQQKASQHYMLKFRSKYLVHPLNISFISYFFMYDKVKYNKERRSPSRKVPGRLVSFVYFFHSLT